MIDIPDALMEKAAQALREWRDTRPVAMQLADDRAVVESTAEQLAETVLAAVWPDLPAARPVVDRDALAEALRPNWTRDETRGIVNAILASGVVQDAADVRREVAEDIAATINDRRLGAPPSWQHGLQEAARIAREAAQP